VVVKSYPRNQRKPFIILPLYFDGVVTAGHKHGVISTTLVTQRTLAEGGVMKIDLVAEASLRGSIPAFKELVAHLQAVIADAEAEQMLIAPIPPMGSRN
jgi:hypothetical protein